MDNLEIDKKPQKVKKDKKKRAGIIALIVGAVVCVAGLVFMLVQLLAEPGLRDAEYLVSVGKWARTDEPSVEWNFTEVGKGVLTTNAHTNDFDFLWALDGKNLEIETDWLYTLNDTYEYKVDQGAKTLTLTSDDKTWTFTPVAE